MNISDENHYLAQNIYEKIIAEKMTIYTTYAILFEIGNYMSKLNKRETGFGWMKTILNNKAIFTLITSENKIFDSALELFDKYQDKEWSITDCISFVIMKKFKIQEVLTFDRHFEQAGFVNLIRHSIS